MSLILTGIVESVATVTLVATMILKAEVVQSWTTQRTMANDTRQPPGMMTQEEVMVLVMVTTLTSMEE